MSYQNGSHLTYGQDLGHSVDRELSDVAQVHNYRLFSKVYLTAQTNSSTESLT